MRKTRYTTPLTIEEDSRAWESAIAGYVRHPGPGELEKSALLILDAQRYFLDPDGPAFIPSAQAILENVRRLARAFRNAGLPVFFTRHLDPHNGGRSAMESWWGRRMEGGSSWCELAPGCGFEPGDPVLDKASYSALRDTNLYARLREKSVDKVVLAGVQTHLCVETTARDAFQSGMTPVVVLDATAAPDLELHLGSLRALGHGFARIATTSAVVSVLAGPVITPPPVVDHENRTRDLLVIGGGPAGIAAAIQGHRMGLDTRLLERDRPGGLINTAFRIENYPGFPTGIRGTDLAARFLAHARDVGVVWLAGEARVIESGKGVLAVRLTDGDTITTRAVISATGTVPGKLGVPGEDDLAGHQIVYRVDRIKPNSRGKTVFVAGGGDCALDQALHLWHMGYRVSVLVRGSQTKAIDLLSKRLADTGVEVRTRSSITGVRKDGDAVVLDIESAGGTEEARADLLLVAVGRSPCLSVLQGIEPDSTPEAADIVGRTKVPGLYLAGDCRRGWIRQTAVASGDGVASAMDAARYLAEGRWK